MEKKMTKVEKFGMVAQVLAGVEVEGKDMLLEFVAAEVARLEKAAEAKKANRKPTKAQVENAKFVVEVGDFFATSDANVAYSADEVAKGCGFDGFSSQKMTALLKQAVESGYCYKVAGADSNKKKVGYKYNVLDSDTNVDTADVE